MNEEREYLIGENCVLKQMRFDEEIHLKERENILYQTHRELEEIERRLRPEFRIPVIKKDIKP